MDLKTELLLIKKSSKLLIWHFSLWNSDREKIRWDCVLLSIAHGLFILIKSIRLATTGDMESPLTHPVCSLWGPRLWRVLAVFCCSAPSGKETLPRPAHWVSSKGKSIMSRVCWWPTALSTLQASDQYSVLTYCRPQHLTHYNTQALFHKEVYQPSVEAKFSFLFW